MSEEEQFQKQMLALGFPTVRIMLYALAKKYGKEHVNQHIEEICHISDVGVLNIDYYNKIKDKKELIIIVLKQCTKDHDLSEQLDKLRPHLDDGKWNDVLKSLSTLILLARTIYTNIYDNNLDLIEEIVGKNEINKYNKLQVDIANTTLYLPDIDDRIGIFLEQIK